MISDLEIKLDDFKLSDYFDLVEEPGRGLFPEVQHELVQMAQANGSRVADKRLNHRIITLPLYALSGNFRQTKDDLANILFSDEQQRLWFSDEPDRYWLVRLTGESSWKRSLENRGEAYGELNFICEDGLSHAMNSRPFPFITTSEGTIATLQNNGTYKTPIDIHVTFTSDANAIGFVSSDNVVQLGTTIPEEESNGATSEKVMNDSMGSSSKNLWSVNTGRPRWRYDDGDSTSQVMGGVTWGAEEVTASNFGTIDPTKPCWHGPTVTRILSEPLSDFEAYHRIGFKPTGNNSQKANCQGLLEINYSDADNHFIVGFEMKDNTGSANKVSFSFFVGDYRFYTGSLPSSVLNHKGGFFGTVVMKKVGSNFTFRLAALDQDSFKEIWSSGSKTWTNNTVAMLSASVINSFMAVWNTYRTMAIKLTHTRITKLISESDTEIPKVFYEGDTLFVEGQSNRVYINGLRDDSYRVIGSSQVFNAPKGTSEVVAISDGTFNGNLKIRERFL